MTKRRLLVYGAAVLIIAAISAPGTLAESETAGLRCDKQHPLACRQAVAYLRHERRKALRAVAWQRKQNLELARQMVGKLTDWTCIHRGEGAWNSNSGNGYHGGLQMDWGFMRTYGPDMLAKYNGPAELWSPREQIIVAQRAFSQGRGYAPWPATSRACGLR